MLLYLPLHLGKEGGTYDINYTYVASHHHDLSRRSVLPCIYEYNDHFHVTNTLPKDDDVDYN